MYYRVLTVNVCLTFTLCISVKAMIFVKCSRLWSFVRLYFVLVLVLGPPVLVLDDIVLATRLATSHLNPPSLTYPNYVTGWLTFGVWQPISGVRTFNIREEDIRLHAQNLGREQKVKRFSTHHEVRFAEHLFNLMLPLQIGIANWRTWTWNKNEGTENPAKAFWRWSNRIHWLEADLCGRRSPEPVLTVTKRSARNFHHDGWPAETTRLSYPKVPIQEVEKKSTSPSIPTKPPMKTTPSFQAGRIWLQLPYPSKVTWSQAIKIVSLKYYCKTNRATFLLL